MKTACGGKHVKTRVKAVVKEVLDERKAMMSDLLEEALF